MTKTIENSPFIKNNDGIQKEARTDEWLQTLIEDISIRFFNRRFKNQAYYNARLRTTGGRYHLNSHNIDINPKVENELGFEALIGVIKHELCHYHLHLEGRGYQHKDLDFKRLLKEVGGSRYVEAIGRPNTIKKYYLYQCSACKHQYKRRRKLNTSRFVCGKCHHGLKLIKMVELD